ncbi:STAS domain-containing protein [Geobacter sp.]|uniref:STAS domain-containing protein n=1 Tax=Geobacter sp. TaxID=46610 RepID=UPI00260E96DC|nr:STAS domain-containing protein [Geobacter sp.]
MSEQADTPARITLGGDWSISGVTERLNELTVHLGSLLAGRGAAAPPPKSEICVRDVETIDASGCQLLAVFVRHLRRHGFAPAIVNPPEHFRSSVSLLGFDDELEGTGGPGK